MSLRENIKKKMDERKLKPFQLEKATGISRTVLFRYLNKDIKQVHIDTILKLSKYFNCSIDELIYGEVPKFLKEKETKSSLKLSKISEILNS